MKKLEKLIQEQEWKDESKKLVDEVKNDFAKRQQDRRAYEAQWQLNMNFLLGNQFCGVNTFGEIEENGKEFYWQQNEVFNHIAPILDVRLAKLNRVRPKMSITPASGNDCDLKTAKISKKIVNSIYNKLQLSEAVKEATKWSEICGTSFYKIIWNTGKGKVIGTPQRQMSTGEADISVCSPFEIYPEFSSNSGIDDCQSIIHAKALPLSVIFDLWGKEVKGENVNIFSLENISGFAMFSGSATGITKAIDGSREGYAVVIERYEAPSKQFPKGRLVIVCGNELLYQGELPYEVNCEGKRGFPFVRQISMETVGSFWGTSMIERLIPLQRSYNIIKNRKHEFINLLSMGVLAVEDGSVDVENLEAEGLAPGKIITYRQGSAPPAFLSFHRVPVDFAMEEQRLLNEFIIISGVSDIMRNSSIQSNSLSGVALQLLIEQDDARISVTADFVKAAIKEIAKHVLHLYRQFATMPRLTRIAGNNGEVELFYFTSSDISSDDVVFESENEIGDTPAQRRNMVFELLQAGLLHSENGKLSNRMRAKALDLLGFGAWESSQDIAELHITKADRENLKLFENQTAEVLEVDEHDIHIAQHTAFMIGGQFDKAPNQKEVTKTFLEHIRMHKKMKAVESQLTADN